MKVKGLKVLRSLQLDLSDLSPAAKERLATKLGDLAIVDVQKKYTENVQTAISKAYAAYLRSVADYFGKKGDSAFALPYNISVHKKMKPKRKGDGFIKRRAVPIPARGPSSTVQISFSIPLPFGTSAGSLLDNKQYRDEEISFSTVFAGLAASTIEKKLQYNVKRHWKRTGETKRILAEELKSLAKRSSTTLVKVSRRRIPIQADFRPSKASPFAKYSIAVNVRLRAPQDRAWAELITESFASGIRRSGFANTETFIKGTATLGSIFNETGFSHRDGPKVHERAFVQEMGVRSGKALFQQLQQVNT